MEQTFAYATWLFTRAICIIYLIAFVSLLPQAQGLWSSKGVSPIREFAAAVGSGQDPSVYWQHPAIFWLSTSDEMVQGVVITGAVAAALVLVGFAQGWCLLLCFGMYLSLVSFGQQFMSFQWDSLLLELGFLTLFIVPWNLQFSMMRAEEPHWVIRGVFYVVLFKLMFSSGIAKLASGDPAWRDFSALAYHYWSQPLPNPIAPFAHALPGFVHRLGVFATFLIELILPFFIFWSRTRAWAGLGFILLSTSILLSGNFAFFNWLTIALSLWLIPDSVWEKLMLHSPAKPELITAPMFPHPFFTVTMGTLALLSIFWCTQFILPSSVSSALNSSLQYVRAFHISNPYGLFSTMTKERNEIVLEGSDDAYTWREYAFKYKPGNIYRRPPQIAPLQPRLDWQMWFAALMPPEHSPWVKTLMLRLLQGSPSVLALLESNPFPEKPPRFVRAKLYAYEFATPDEIIDSGLWWKRTPLGNFSPILTASP